ncbi:hypothetical protein TRFO_30261 [Tritrichomonas foetus]|uniref:Protein kinase domain-containing protein n=1 Tax=Tritrichomonas foetus TaxID=1144522 RepID=A0A1J4JU61_9EUKA|nr:hypothetical protein TRFO_30261 [Tritrichomonas foetus]|eukprot:OHT02539.1 hypothetical protein TRFO_30261 [Tritrichomonas foetus]
MCLIQQTNTPFQIDSLNSPMTYSDLSDPLERFAVSDIIGRGTFSTVCKAIDTITNEVICIKIIEKRLFGQEKGKENYRSNVRIDRLSRHLHGLSNIRNEMPNSNSQNLREDYFHTEISQQAGQFDVEQMNIHIQEGCEVNCALQEAAVMSKLDHPNIAKFYGIVEDSERYYLFMEYCEGQTLLDLINNCDEALPTITARHIFRQIIRAVSYLHEQGFCHRDIKPENIIIDSCHRIKLIDFGFSTPLKKYDPETQTETTNFLSSFCGSLYYVAPEVLMQNPYDGSLADVWSLGVVLYAMVFGRLPFEGTASEIEHQIFSFQFEIMKNSFIPWACQDLISKMLVIDASERITTEQIKNHTWINGFIDQKGHRFSLTTTSTKFSVLAAFRRNSSSNNTNYRQSINQYTVTNDIPKNCDSNNSGNDNNQSPDVELGNEKISAMHDFKAFSRSNQATINNSTDYNLSINDPSIESMGITSNSAITKSLGNFTVQGIPQVNLPAKMVIFPHRNGKKKKTIATGIVVPDLHKPLYT